MIWLTWRQFRVQALATVTALALLAGLLAATGPHLVHLYQVSGLAACRAPRDCGTIAGNLLNEVKDSPFYNLLFYLSTAALYLAPGLIGVFWGAPLVSREIETGTFKLAWTQTITRTRWLAVKLAFIGLAAMGTAGVASLMVTWWEGPITRAILVVPRNLAPGVSRLDPLVFGAQAIAPVGYAAFAFALGVTAGVLIRRTTTAMAATLAGFALVQLAWPNWVRPHLIAPVRSMVALNAAAINSLSTDSSGQMTVVGSMRQPGAWVLSNETMTRAGHLFTGPATHACLSPDYQACVRWLATQHLRQLITYQPGSRFWAFQWTETGIFLGVAVALASLCVWWIRRRAA